jgi:hypothetical protein
MSGMVTDDQELHKGEGAHHYSYKAEIFKSYLASKGAQNN